MATEMEERAAEDTIYTAFRRARADNRIYVTGIDIRTLRANYGSLADVTWNYLHGIGPERTYDIALADEPNPLQPFLENLERRHR